MPQPFSASHEADGSGVAPSRRLPPARRRVRPAGTRVRTRHLGARSRARGEELVPGGREWIMEHTESYASAVADELSRQRLMLSSTALSRSRRRRAGR